MKVHRAWRGDGVELARVALQADSAKAMRLAFELKSVSVLEFRCWTGKPGLREVAEATQAAVDGSSVTGPSYRYFLSIPQRRRVVLSSTPLNTRSA